VSARHLPERFEEPTPLRRRQFPANDVKITVVSQQLEEDIRRAIPRIQHLLDSVFMSIQPEPDRPLIGFVPEIAIDV
jgi:hypothetical protein